MTDDRLEALVGAWMKSSLAPEPDARESATAILARLDEEGQGVRQPKWLRGTIAPFLKAAAALVLVVVVAAFLSLTLGPAEPPDQPQGVIVGASQAPSPTMRLVDPADPVGPPIHWQSDEVDLQAEGMTLRIGDRVYTGAGASFAIDARNDGPDSWSLSTRWSEDGDTLRLRLSFAAHEDRWWVGFHLLLPDAFTPDGTRYSGAVALNDASDLPGALALDEPWAVDWQAGSSVERPSCGGFGFETLDVSLELDGLRLKVVPPDPSVLEILGAAVDVVREGTGLADPPDAVAPIELSCPPDPIVEQRIGDLDVAGVPVSDTVLRLVGDGYHDYDKPMRDVAVRDDGSVLVATAKALRELGSDARRIDTSDVMRNLARVDLAADGTTIIRGGERKTYKDIVALRDGRGWSVLPPYAIGSPGGGPVRDLNDPVIARDGSLYVGVPGGLGRFDGSQWSLVKRQQTSPRATAGSVGSFGPTKGLVVSSDGAPWVGIAHTVSELRDGRWIEHDPFADFIAELLSGLSDRRFRGSLLDLGISPDDTLWAFVQIRPEELDRSSYALGRYRDGAWSVYPIDELLSGALPSALNILVDDEGAVLLLLEGRPRNGVPRPDGSHLLRFDGESATELARLPSRSGFRLSAVGPDGTVWLIGGYPKGADTHRIHVVAPRP